MATIDFSAGLMAGLPARVLRLNESANTQQLPATSGLLLAGNGFGFPVGRIYLMKGTVPTSFASIVDFSTRSADILCTFSAFGGILSPTQQNVNPAIITSLHQNATATGTCTWFWWVVQPSSYDSPENQLSHQIIGTVGVTGSGADLELATTGVVAGEPYRILNLRLRFPSTWTY